LRPRLYARVVFFTASVPRLKRGVITIFLYELLFAFGSSVYLFDGGARHRVPYTEQLSQQFSGGRYA
jgi:hypothetical protein